MEAEKSPDINSAHEHAVEGPVSYKTLELLKEIDEICSAQHIPYFLEGYAALLAYQDHALSENLANPIISMFASDLNKFIAEVKHRNNPCRYLNRMGEDPHFPSFHLHYGDVNSTYCEPHLMHIIKKCGIHITIVPLRRSDLRSKKYRLLYGLESAWESANISKKVSLKRMVSTLGTRLICSIVGYRRYGAWLFNQLVSMSSQKNGTLYTKALWERIKIINEFYYAGTSPVTVNDQQLLMSYQPKHYLDAHFKGWSKHQVLVPAKDPSRCFVSAYVPFESVISHFQKKWGSNQWRLLEKQRKLASVVSFFSQKNSYVWTKARFSEDRFYFWELLMPKKDEILELFEKEQYSEIRNIMCLYLTKLQASIKKGVPLCFDVDLLNVALCVLYEHSDYSIIKSIKSKVPNGYLKEISIKTF